MPVEIIAAPHAFATGAVRSEAPEGLSVAEMLTGDPGPIKTPYALHVFLGDRLLPADTLHRIHPKAGARITVRVAPAGGGGGEGGGGKDTLRTVGTIAVIAASIFAAPYLTPYLTGIGFSATTAAAVAPGIISTVGLLAVNALVPPRTGGTTLGALSGTGGGAQESPNYAISGARNAAQPFGTVPSIAGFHRMVPPLGAQTYTEILAGDQFLRILVIWGYGPLDISDVRIGDTPIGNYDDVEVETRQGRAGDAPLALYPGAVDEQSLSITLSQATSWHTRTAGADADELSVDITFAGGLVAFDNNGNRSSRTVEIEIEYAVAGSGTWVAAGTLTISEASTQAVRRGLRWSVTRGTYEVRLRRTTADSTETRIQDVATWSTLRAFTNEDPVQFEVPLAKSAIRIRATDQLNSVVDQLSAVVKSEVTSWNGSAWVTALSNNPADLFRHVLQGPANVSPVADAGLDLETLQEWADYCTAEGLTFNHIRDFVSSVWDTLADIAAAGRAAPAIRDGKWSVVIDREKPLIVQHFTPRNSWGFSGNKIFDDLPHAWRVSFINEAADYARDEIIVYDDGYSAANATTFEGLEFPGVTDPDLNWKHGRYHVAAARLRPETYTFSADLEHLVAERGDRIRVAHDVPAFGLSWGRVKAVAGDGGSPENAVSVDLDEVCPMETGTLYAVRFRIADAADLLANVVTVEGEQKTLTFETPVPMAQAPNVGDLFLFGERDSESVDLVIKAIEPAGDLTARITCVDYAPAIFEADQGAIPPFDSQITLPPAFFEKPATPTIRTIQSDLTVAERNDDGTVLERIVITTDPPSVFAPGLIALQAQVQRQGTDTWNRVVSQNLPTRVTIPDVIGGEAYNIRIRRVTTGESERPGLTSDWHYLADYTVIGKTEPPADVTALALESERAVWDYEPPLDFKGFLLRFHRGERFTWADADPAHDGYISETVFDIRHLRGGTFTLLLKGVDSGDRESVNPASLVVNLGDPIVDNVILSTDYVPIEYGLKTGIGTIAGGALIDDCLEALDTALFWDANDQAVFWDQHDSEPFWGSLYEQMTYEMFHIPDPAAGGTLSLDTEIASESYTLRYRTNGDLLLWSTDPAPLWSDDAAPLWGALPAYKAWPGKVEVLSRERMYFEVVTAGGLSQGTICGWTLNQDVPDVLETLSDVALDPAGTRLPITKQYARILNISLTLQQDGGDARTVKIIDKDIDPGPLVQAFDVGDVGAAATIDARVQGY